MHLPEILIKPYIPNLPIKETAEHLFLKAKSWTPREVLETTRSLTPYSVPFITAGCSFSAGMILQSNKTLFLLSFLIGSISIASEAVIVANLRARNHILRRQLKAANFKHLLEETIDVKKLLEQGVFPPGETITLN